MFGPGMLIFGVLIPIAVVALIAYGVWELARSREPQPAVVAGGAGLPASASARSILDERFARGEVDVNEYVQRRALLDGTVPSPPTDAMPATAPTEPIVAGPATEAPTAEVDATGTAARSTSASSDPA